MSSSFIPHPLIDTCREIIQQCTDSGEAAAKIEAFLEREFKGLPSEEKLARLRAVVEVFSSAAEPAVPLMGNQWLDMLVQLLLGKPIEEVCYSPEELSQRLATAMNTVFDSLNELKQAINATLLGQSIGEETIRHIIVSNVTGSVQEGALQEYLDQIKEAFFIMYIAFKEASSSRVGELLGALAPEQLAAELNSGLKVGPFRKAELYDLFEAKYRGLAEARQKGRLTEIFVRDFEQVCQSLYAEKGKQRG